MGKTSVNPDHISSLASDPEQREHARHQVTFPGKLFLPAEDVSFDCQVLNVSVGGAGVQCREPPPLQSFVVLYIDGFGRFECITAWYGDGELGLRFVCKEAKRHRLLNDILVCVGQGSRTNMRARRHARNATARWEHLVRPNGDSIRCEAIDISAQGISLKTDVRPPIGELTKLGHTYGRVVRHHDEGIAIEFLVPSDGAFDVN